MVHEELLKVLIGNVNAELLKAFGGQDGNPQLSLASAALIYGIYLLSLLNAYPDILLLYSRVLMITINACCQS